MRFSTILLACAAMPVISPRARMLRVLGNVLVAWLAAAPVSAAQVEGLYEGRSPVASEAHADRIAAMGLALRQVLTKLSGLERPTGPAVEAAVADPAALMQQFGYTARADPDLPYTLWVRFEREAVDALLREAGLPVWGAERPGVLAWIVLQQPGASEIVTADGGGDDAGVAGALAGHAWEHGVPLAFPLLDLEDRLRVQPTTLEREDLEAVAEASRRYAPAALLIGWVEADGAGAWIARWRFEDGDDSTRWEVRGPRPADTTAGVIARVFERLAGRYVLAAERSAPVAVRVTVGDVRTLGDYARALEYLQGLDQVSELEFAGARGEEFTFRMRVRGGAQALRRLASFGGVLAAHGGDETAVRFRLLP